MARHARRRTRWRTPALAVGVPVVVVAVLAGAWAIDTAGAGSVRNVEVAGRQVGSREPAEVAEAVADLAADELDAEVRIVADDDEYTTTAGELGMVVDEATTVERVLDAGSDGFVPLRPLAWAWSFVRDHDVDVAYDIDAAKLADTLVTLEGDARVAPQEPTFEPGAGGLQVVPGVDGSGIDPDEVADLLPRAANGDERPIVLEVARTTLEPLRSDSSVQAVADQVNALTASPLTVRVGDESTQVSPPTMWSWVRPVEGPDGLTVAFDQAAVVETLASLLPDMSREPENARFDLVGGRPVVIAGHDGTACCADDTSARLLAAVQSGTLDVAVDVKVTPPELTTDEANALGIVEEVGQPDEFGPTTRHAAGQPRVANIHRIADIVRGHVIEPGATFSVNRFVGKRTRERGFVNAPVIYQGEFQEDIGGGVSQFATTLFNAAFFAGLDFGEYQSHSIRIDRYPRGREATISYPHPDLEIVNNTPYGVMLWPTYTDSSVTVHIYSTHHVDVDAGATRDSSQGRCTRVTQPRTRTYVDGRVETDSVFAVYRPGEGIDC